MVVRVEFGFLVSENCLSARKTNFWSRFFRYPRGNRFSWNDFSVIRAYYGFLETEKWLSALNLDFWSPKIARPPWKTNFWSRFFRCTRGNRFSWNDFSVIRAYYGFLETKKRLSARNLDFWSRKIARLSGKRTFGLVFFDVRAEIGFHGTIFP